MTGGATCTVLNEVHRSCAAVVEGQQLVSLDAAAIQAYAAQLDPAAVKAAQAKAGVLFPVKFDNQEAEITFLALYHLLDFGSGYDALLRASSGRRGARETMQYGCFGLALSAKRLDGPWMRAFSLYNLHTAFGFDSKVEQELQPGITISKAGPLAPLATAIHTAIVETGQALEAAGVKSLGALVLQHLQGLQAAGKPFTAASLVEELADAIPGFQDSALFTTHTNTSNAPPPQQPEAAAGAAAAQPADTAADASAADGNGGSSIKVVYLRKAQALAADLGRRFGREDARFAWSDADRLSADSGPTLIAVLHHLGLVQLSTSLLSYLQQQQQHQLPLGQQERALRAAAVAAVDAVVAAAAAAAAAGNAQAAHSSGEGSQSQPPPPPPAAAAAAAPFSARELSDYLLSLVKEEEGSGLLRFQGAVLTPCVTRGTTAY